MVVYRDVVVIGAGPAGIAAGLGLQENGYSVRILEGQESIGGLSKTLNIDGNYIDLGGHRFFTKSDEVNTWWNDRFKGSDHWRERRRLSRIYYKGSFFDYPVSPSYSTFKNLGLSDTFKIALDYVSSSLNPLEESSLENFYINRFGKKLYSMFFEGYTEKVWGIHPSKLSPDWGSQRVKGVSIGTLLKNMFIDQKEASLIEKFLYPDYGPGEMWQLAVDEFKNLGGEVSLNSNVNAIKKEDDGYIVVFKNALGGIEEVSCKYIVSSAPLRDLLGMLINLDTHIPENIVDIREGLNYRDYILFGVMIPKEYMKRSLPDNWIYVQDDTVKLGRVQVYNNWSKTMVSGDGIWLGLEYFCNEGDKLWGMEESEFLEMSLGELKKISLIKDAVFTPETYHKENVKKAYPVYNGAYDRLDEVQEYLKGLKNIFTVGRNGQHRYNNMDHSILTAMKAVEYIIGNPDVGYDDLWGVNTEENYHESKEVS